uniref:Uncharacterized protein n=1 Tax=Alexandrium catenella TaxID=2925 RepID=A0A7S1W383_ALECA|mmetsp:Transcript_37503/g.101526  ORF Transcript_37503/g.101526 Transcript_37503/m.101526 type:complete len:303 (+) Transcript_37503:77-985(+)
MPPAVPKVEVSAQMDMQFNASGKVCGPMHMPWPAGMRSSSHIAGLRGSGSEPVIAGPGTALESECQRRSERGQEFRERLRKTASTLGGSCPPWAEITVPASRPSSSSSAYAAGMRSLGTLHSRPISTGFIDCSHRSGNTGIPTGTYNPAKHTWAHPLARSEKKRQTAPAGEPGSWSWTMHKAKDHLGFGPNGVVDRRDGVTCAVSEDTPAWFVGTRTHAGPMSTKTVPVRRAPRLELQSGGLKVMSRTFQRGDDLSCTTTLHDRPTPPTPSQRHSRSGDHTHHQARQAHLEFGGCQVKGEFG